MLGHDEGGVDDVGEMVALGLDCRDGGVDLVALLRPPTAGAFVVVVVHVHFVVGLGGGEEGLE